MTGVLYGLAKVCVRNRFAVTIAWLLVTIVLVAVSHRLGDNTNDNLSLPGTDSQRATNALALSFPDQSNGTSPIVLHAKAGGKLTEPPYKEAVAKAASEVAKAENVAAVVSPLSPQGAAQLSKDQATGYLSVTLSKPPGELSVSEAQKIIDAAGAAKAAGLQVETGGQLGQKVSKPATESSELIGIVAAMAILTFTFGTVVAMLLPIVNAILALLCTLAIVRMLGHVVTVPTVAPTLATMIGLGVGIDYSLFIVTRHFRGEDEGLDRHESIARAAATSGGAVFFAGGTVTIALVSLAVAGIPLVTTMGEMAAIAVIVAVLAALTSLPAMLAITGGHIHSLQVRKRPPDEEIQQGTMAAWAHALARRPWVGGLAALAILIPLTIPLLSLNLGQQDTAALSTSTTARRAYDLIAHNFGAGANGPLIVAASLNPPAKSAQDQRLAALQKDIAQTEGVAAVTPVQVSKDGTTAYFNAVATSGPAEKATEQLVERLRKQTIPKAEASGGTAASGGPTTSGAAAGGGLRADVGGSTAGYVDLAARISSKLPLQILVVIALSFVLLVLSFRTMVVPAQAAVMNLLSIGAAYGVLTAIFQYGWLGGAIGLPSSVPVVSYVPLFMFAILFGLSMDYEVFLVSQIEEHVHAGQENRESVVSGLLTSARVITSAALIMVFVFGSFVLNGDPTIKQFGVGLAVAVALDATVVRCLLVPSVMVIMGRVNWWIPRWLDRALPQVSIEGAEFFEQADARAPAARA